MPQHDMVDTFGVDQRCQRVLIRRSIERHNARVEILSQFECTSEILLSLLTHLVLEVRDDEVGVQTLRDTPSATYERSRKRILVDEHEDMLVDLRPTLCELAHVFVELLVNFLRRP